MLQEDKKGQRNKVGACGELTALKYLEKKGFTLVERNYLRKCGEIDLIMKEETARSSASSGQVLHFVEVKTVSYETKAALQHAQTHDSWRPEEQVHAFKLKKLSRTIELWCHEQSYDGDWCIDVVAVRIVLDPPYATVKYLENIV